MALLNALDVVGGYERVFYIYNCVDIFGWVNFYAKPSTIPQDFQDVGNN